MTTPINGCGPCMRVIGDLASRQRSCAAHSNTGLRGNAYRVFVFEIRVSGKWSSNHSQC